MFGIILGAAILFIGEISGKYFIKPHYETDFQTGFWIGTVSCLGCMVANLIF
jgi:hypothetical protein